MLHPSNKFWHVKTQIKVLTNDHNDKITKSKNLIHWLQKPPESKRLPNDHAGLHQSSLFYLFLF
jgi:hypothetical protein